VSRILGRTQSEIAPIPDWIDVRVIAAGATDTATVPASVDCVLMTTTSPVWFRRSAGAVVGAVPGADLSDGKGSLYFSGSGLFEVSPGEVISFAAPAATGCTVSLGWYGKAAP